MQNYNLPSVNFDNTFGGVEFTIVSDPEINLTGANAKIHVRKDAGSPLVKEFIPEITLPNKVKFPSQLIDIPAGTYKWDLKLILSDGVEKTYIGGEWVINSVITVG